jgi:hypothetical protein
MNSQSSPFQKLENILILEKNLGCTDRAVIGGLGGFISHWCDEARQGAPDASVRQLVEDTCALLETYSDESVSRRTRAPQV